MALRFNRRWHWRTKTGEVVKIREMGDTHLLNVIRFLERFVHAKILAAADQMEFGAGQMTGEMAQDSLERAALAMYAHPEEYAEDFEPPELKWLIREADRRRLNHEENQDAR